jgi:alpha-beta hydrolase superfamily lysophospholipase
VRIWFSILLILCTSGCGRFAARRIVQAPNTYPKWLAPDAPVTFTFRSALLTNFTSQYLNIPSPPARIRYRIIEPCDYHFRWTNQFNEATGKLDLQFGAQVPSPESDQSSSSTPTSPRGTIILLHGYGDSGLAMFPWALLLAEQGWRCVVVDLRGHAGSSGERVYFGVQELHDLRALLTQLEQNHHIDLPVSLVGHSFGAVLALRWKLADPRIGRIVSMSPYADLGAAIQNVRRQYARWLPKSFIAAGLRELPHLLHTEPSNLHPACWINHNLSGVLFMAGQADAIATLDQVQKLHRLAGEDNEILILPQATHETLPFHLDQLAGPVSHWLNQDLATPVTKIVVGTGQTGETTAEKQESLSRSH